MRVALAICFAGCRGWHPDSDTVEPDAPEPCHQPLSAYCDPCPDLAQAVEEGQAYEVAYFMVIRCEEGGFRAASGDGFSGGSSYFDSSGRMVAAAHWSDNVSFCRGERTYGPVPACEPSCYEAIYCDGVPGDQSCTPYDYPLCE